MKIRAIITGSTGMVGEGVLHECLLHPGVEAVLVINRRPCGVRHAKLKEIIHADFSSFSSIEHELAGYNAGFFCMGSTSLGKSDEEYRRLTYDLTMALALPLARLNPHMTITYVSGVGTDATEKGRVRWARVKGKTENELLRLPFRQAFMFRPGYIQPTEGMKHTYRMYTVLGPLYPVLRMFFPGYMCTLAELGTAMINTVLHGYDKPVLEVADIRKRARV